MYAHSENSFFLVQWFANYKNAQSTEAGHSNIIFVTDGTKSGRQTFEIKILSFIRALKIDIAYLTITSLL